MGEPMKDKAISVRLPEKLVAEIDEFVKANAPFVKDRTQLVEIALHEYLGREPKPVS